MSKFAPLFLLVFVAACGSTRSGECDDACPDDTTQADTCKTSVETCEEAGGDLVDTCIDAVIAAYEITCAVVDTDAE
jgi:hypothetical protein